MPWRLALRVIRERRPPLDLLTYQIHIPSPRYGSCGFPPWWRPPPPELPTPPPSEARTPAPAAAPPPDGRASAMRIMAAASSAAEAIRAVRRCRRNRVDAQGRLPNDLRLVLRARICRATPTGAEEPPGPLAVPAVVSRNPRPVMRRQERQATQHAKELGSWGGGRIRSDARRRTRTARRRPGTQRSCRCLGSPRPPQGKRRSSTALDADLG